MANADMTTTKIDRGSLSKLRMLADRENRSQPSQLAIIIEHAFRSNPAELTDQEFFTDMMSSIVSDAEQGIVGKVAAIDADEFTASGRISWGEIDGRVVGVMADGTRCDVDGNVLIP